MKIGIDLGGSHIGIGVVQEDNILEKQEVDLTEEMIRKGNIKKYIEDYIIEQIRELLQKYEIELIGVATPGTPKNGKITNMVNLGIQELEIENIVKKIFQGRVQVKNDAKCAALAEKIYGSLKPYQDAVFLCLGTGIGGSAFIQEKELKPSRNPGFEIGHMIIQKDGKECKCGKKGCFETYCSMKRLKNRLIKEMELKPEIEAKELLEILTQKKQEVKIQEILEEYIQNLIIGLSNIIDLLEPQAICLGGSFVYFEKVLYHRLLETYQERKYVFNKENLPELKLATLGNDAGIIGACSDTIDVKHKI